MNKKIVSIILIIGITLSTALLLRRYVGDLRPVLLPSNKSVPSSTSTSRKGVLGGNLPIPLTVPTGFHIGLFTDGLGTPRDLQFTDLGTLLVSDPSKNTVTALKDNDGDGIAEVKKVVIAKGNHVHGLAFHKGKIYVAELNSVEIYDWNDSKLQATHQKSLLSYPGRQNHTNRTLVFGADNKLYISLGSNCNVCVEQDKEQGTVMVANQDGTGLHVFAKGQRNAPFLAINPTTQALWATGMGRDYLGDTLPPDEINILENGKDYGWPYCYGNKVYDRSFDKASPSYCTQTVPPIYEIPAHSAPLGLTFVQSKNFPSRWENDLLVAYHGSWNRSVPDGYKVVRMQVSGDQITRVEDFVTGFISGSSATGRPVDLTFDKSGNLYISDDKAGNIYIVSHE